MVDHGAGEQGGRLPLVAAPLVRRVVHELVAADIAAFEVAAHRLQGLYNMGGVVFYI